MSEPLRDTISQAFDEAVDMTPEVTTDVPAIPQGDPKTPELPLGEPPKADRARDEQGRFVETKEEKAVREAKPKGTAPAAPAPQASVVAAPAKPAIQRPSTWKKDHWEAYDKLATENPALAQYILQRESEFAKGVSTYKQEWESAKPLLEAMAPFMPLLEQHRIPPAQWINRLGEAHKQLSLGTPEQKISVFARLAQDYQIPLQNLVVQGQDGKLYINPNLGQQQQASQQTPAFRPEDVTKIVKQQLEEQRSEAAIEAFAADKEKHPHFDAVRDTMAGLLQAGLAEGLEDAYKAALQHPRHAEIYTAMQEQQRQQDEAKAIEERRKATEAARRKAVSPRSATPTSPANAGEGKKGLRATIESAADEIFAGRV